MQLIKIIKMHSMAALILAGAFLLYGCGNSAHAPVYDLRHTSPNVTHYSVRKGDTLYAIAWRFNLDYKKLAGANGIPYPYTIFVGQRVRLTEGRGRKAARNSPSPTLKPVLSLKNVTKVTVTPKNSKVSQKPGGNKAPNSGSSHQKGVQKRSGSQTRYHDVGWRKPVDGKIISRFGSRGKLSKGVDFAARAGSPVISSRSGTVVYAGSRLKGYGNLVIIKHDEIYLSAYAHNRKILVKEGDLIKQGQKIAEVGSSGTDTAKLHFQIRKHGKPIDPLRLLQK
ncbi:Murein hydrolase activator NlpD [BD1-7 clade bacterium]|uniref:Murein hydrolase activator NlpD n=1 Tax=BD1-7 clade bacterium TaxID=2029982 RepID=A0A5S9PCL9_9GAMM|nr:Murein hydrolase activator NlpD [BD1-7 clade bacterium]CAA0102275.1 Murein hydrolase activator NlpD [BD1-7 clade bacterium]